MSPQLRRCIAVGLALVAVLSTASPALTQVTQLEWHYQIQNPTRVIVSNASVISITASDKNELSIRGEVLAGAIQSQEVRVQSEVDHVEVSCSPVKSDRKIFVAVQVPSKSIVETRTNGQDVRVVDPAENIIISYASKELVQLSVPETTSLDMKNARNAVERRSLGPLGNGRIGIAGQRLGTGPPYVEVRAEKPLVVVSRGVFEPPVKAATLAAMTIANRGGSMGEALKRSAPQLIRPADRLIPTPEVPLAASDDDTVKLETYLVNLNISATDSASRSIPDLTKDDFEIYEDGVRQTITFFSPQSAPFNLVLLIDMSGSVRERIDLIRETAHHFLDVVNSLDSVAVVTFTTDVIVASRPTKDRDDLRDSIDLIATPGGGTAFYDALGYVLVEILRKVKGQRNAVLALTDGEDNSIQSKLELHPVGATAAAGSFLSFDELLTGAAEGDALIYPIHLNPSVAQMTAYQSTTGSGPHLAIQMQPLRDRGRVSTTTVGEIAKAQLHALADGTGGRLFHADRIEDLKGVFGQVAAELRTVYSLAYTPTNTNFDGRFRRIKVVAKKPGVAIRTRPGYFGK